MPASVSPLPYTGNKSCIADVILAAMPPHDVYIEPCMGSAEVFFRKRAANRELLNDYNGDIVNFFRVLQSNEQLQYLLGRIALSVNAEMLFRGNRELLASIPNVLDDLSATDDLVRQANREEIEQAAAFLENQFYSFSSTGNAYGIATKDIIWRIPRLIAAMQRLRKATILHRDYKDVITYGACEGAFIFLDPPYKDTESMYDKSNFDSSEHALLFNLMDEVHTQFNGKCKFLITYNADDEIINMAESYGFHTLTEKRLHNMRQAKEGGSMFPELLIANYDLFEQSWENGRMLDGRRQLNLFDIYQL